MFLTQVIIPARCDLNTIDLSLFPSRFCKMGIQQFHAFFSAINISCAITYSRLLFLIH